MYSISFVYFKGRAVARCRAADEILLHGQKRLVFETQYIP